MFEGEIFVVDVWRDMDDADISADIYDRYDVEWVCFCELVDRPADVTTKEGTYV